MSGHVGPHASELQIILWISTFHKYFKYPGALRSVVKNFEQYQQMLRVGR